MSFAHYLITVGYHGLRLSDVIHLLQHLREFPLPTGHHPQMQFYGHWKS